MTTRVRRTFWALVAIAVLATGGLSTALNARPGPVAGFAVATTSVTLATSAFLAMRILLVVGRRAPVDNPPIGRE